MNKFAIALATVFVCFSQPALSASSASPTPAEATGLTFEFKSSDTKEVIGNISVSHSETSALVVTKFASLKQGDYTLQFNRTADCSGAVEASETGMLMAKFSVNQEGKVVESILIDDVVSLTAFSKGEGVALLGADQKILACGNPSAK